MYKIARSIKTSSHTSEELFNMAAKGARHLVSRWKLDEPKIEAFEDSGTLNIRSLRFKGSIKVIDNELAVEGTFQDFLKFGQEEAEEQLDFWIQELFGATYDT